MRKLFHFFIDGLGLGEETEDNPVQDLFSESMGGLPLSLNSVRIKGSTAPSPGESSPPPDKNVPCIGSPVGDLPSGDFHIVNFPAGVLVPTDAVMGVSGLPQSATGQTSLFTGINAQKRLGYHLTAFPNEELLGLIADRSLLKVLKEAGIGVTAANMYTREFFELREQRRKNMFAVSTLSIRAADIPFRFPPDYLEGRALFADITNDMIRKRGYEVDLITPEAGAERILTILKEARAVFFEYFMTDTLGHRRDRQGLRGLVDDLNRFIAALLSSGALQDGLTILITSDHGNAEDISTALHTANPVPVIVFSNEQEVLDRAAGSIRDLTDTYGFVQWYFGIEESGINPVR